MMLSHAHSLATGLVLFLATAAAAAPDAPESAAPPPVAPADSSPAGDAASDATAKTAPQPRPRLSTAITSQIARTVPAWKLTAAEKTAKAPPPPPLPTATDVVKMAPVVVNGTRIPQDSEKQWLTPKGRDVLLMNQYLSSFDRNVLNRFTLPLIGVSNEARARMMYEEDKRLSDLKWINDEISDVNQVDPAAAKELERIRNATFSRTEP